RISSRSTAPVTSPIASRAVWSSKAISSTPSANSLARSKEVAARFRQDFCLVFILTNCPLLVCCPRPPFHPAILEISCGMMSPVRQENAAEDDRQENGSVSKSILFQTQCSLSSGNQSGGRN